MKRIDGTTINTVNCFQDPTLPIRHPRAGTDPCRTIANTSRPALYFEGDSHAHSIIPIGVSLLANGHYNVGFFARGGCPAPYLTPWHNDRHKLERYKLRESHYKTRIDYLLSVLKPGDRIVFVSSLPSYLGEGVTPSSATVAAGYRSAIRKVDREVKARGGRLVLVSPLPSFPDSQIKTPLSMCKIEWFRPAWTVPLDCKILICIT